MLSICIPIYNFDCSRLINDLHEQVKACSSKVEIILMDDGSDAEYRKRLEPLDEKISFIQLKKNVGRSKIRNLLAKEASYEYLLFIDGDSSVISNDFIVNYTSLLEAENTAKVICGGSVYSNTAPSKNQLLRWKYSKARERKSLEFSKKNPYQSFTTNNFLIEKETFLTIKFDERIEQYGHEDTLFGYQLKQKDISIMHIENVVLNGDIDTNEKYLRKTHESIANLLKIASIEGFKEDFIQLIPLLQIYFRIKLLGLEILLRIWFRYSKKRLERKFVNGKVNLTLFDFYRLGVLSFLFKKLRHSEE